MGPNEDDGERRCSGEGCEGPQGASAGFAGVGVRLGRGSMPGLGAEMGRCALGRSGSGGWPVRSRRRCSSLVILDLCSQTGQRPRRHRFDRAGTAPQRLSELRFAPFGPVATDDHESLTVRQALDHVGKRIGGERRAVRGARGQERRRCCCRWVSRCHRRQPFTID